MEIYSNDEIINALNIIKNMCSSHADCKDCCCFSGLPNNPCKVTQGLPEDWIVHTPEHDIWRALLS